MKYFSHFKYFFLTLYSLTLQAVLNREIPFLRIIIALCSGIVCGYFFRPPNLFFILSGISIIIMFAASLLFNRQMTNPLFGIAFIICLFTAGLWLYTLEKSSLTELESRETYFSGYLSEYPEAKEKTCSMVFKMQAIIEGEKQIPAKGSILLYHRKDKASAEFRPGDMFVLRCRPLKIINRGNPEEFNYSFYMENRGIGYYAFTDSSDITDFRIPEHRRLVHKALIIREKIIDMFRERGIEGERLALVAAITLGQKNMLDPEQKQYFIRAGVMHIMAVSGLHAVILSLFIFKMLFFLKGRLNIMRVMITLVLLWLFAFITGLTPSVLRATIMFTFLQAGNLMKRPVNQINSVLASAFILILVRPSVIFDAGFLLSYSAVIFIISFYRDFYLTLTFRYRLTDLIWQSAAVSIVAQAGTLPLTLMLFNRFPTWFILSNIIIVPLSSVVIIMGCLVPLTFPVEFISRPLAIALDFLTGLTEKLTAVAASLPFSTIDNIGLSIPECILLTITIFLSLKYLLERKSISVVWPGMSLLCLVVAGTLEDIATRRSEELIVYNTTGHTAIGIRTGKNLTIYCDTLYQGMEAVRHSSAKKLAMNSVVIRKDSYLLKTGDNSILLTRKLNFSVLSKYKPDLVILTGEKPEVERIVQPVWRLKGIVTDPQASPGPSALYNLKAINTDTLHFVKKEGAFRLKL